MALTATLAFHDDVSVKKAFLPLTLISADCYAASQFPQS